MNYAESWLRDRMTVRRWLAAVAVAGVLAAVVGVGALAAVRADEPADPVGDAAAVGVPAGSGADPQSPPAGATTLSVNVGLFSLVDGRAGVTLELFPVRQPPTWRVVIRSVPATPGAAAREVDLPAAEVGPFGDALADALRRRDPSDDRTVGGVRLHAVEVASGDVQVDLQDVGVLRLDADAAADLQRLLARADGYRRWLAERTIPLRMSSPLPSTPTRLAKR